MRAWAMVVTACAVACGGGQVRHDAVPKAPEAAVAASPVQPSVDVAAVKANGLAMLMGGDVAGGRDQLLGAVAAGTTDPVVYYNLAVADMKMRDWQAAEDHARKAVEYSKGSRKALALLERVMQKTGRTDLMVAFLEGLNEKLGEVSDVRMALVRAKIAAGRTTEALTEATELLRKDEANTEIMKLIARAYMAMNRSDAARFVLAQVLEIKKDGEALDMLAHLTLSEGDEARAAVLFRQAVDLDSRLVDAHNNLGVLLQSMGDSEGAMKEFEAALAADPDDFAVRVNLGNAYRRSLDFARAIEAYKAALALEPSCADCYFNLGVAELENRGSGPDEPSHYRRAMEYFRTYKEMRKTPKGDEKADKYYDEARRMAEKLEQEAAKMREAGPAKEQGTGGEAAPPAGQGTEAAPPSGQGPGSQPGQEVVK